MHSMLYTMGTALSRAAEQGCPVRILLEGAWIEGRVAANDGTGVVIETPQGEHCVLRTERISAVHLSAALPYRPQLEDHLDEAIPMPGPRYAAV